MSIENTKIIEDGKPSILPKVNFFLIIAMSVIFMVHSTDQEITNSYVLESLGNVGKNADFSVTEIQALNSGFLLSDAGQERHLTGIKFTGRIINTQSVQHLNASFNISVNGKDKEFTINKISSGNSTAFNVYIPDLEAEDARYVKIRNINSTIRYYTK